MHLRIDEMTSKASLPFLSGMCRVLTCHRHADSQVFQRVALGKITAPMQEAIFREMSLHQPYAQVTQGLETKCVYLPST
jgi:hypothetical protein